MEHHPEHARYRSLLLAKRRELVGDILAVEDEAITSSGGASAHLSTHIADHGSDTYDQDVLRALAEGERELLREIDDALERIENGTFGTCEKSGEPISIARLDAQPWARCTVEAERARETETRSGPSV